MSSSNPNNNNDNNNPNNNNHNSNRDSIGKKGYHGSLLGSQLLELEKRIEREKSQKVLTPIGGTGDNKPTGERRGTISSHR